MSETTSEFDELKGKLHATWTAGDYGRIAEGLAKSAREFLDRLAIGPRDRLLDVACGAGQIAIPAAHAGARVTGVDIAPNWIAQARDRAAAEGLDVQFDVGDAEALPYDDGSFDVVVSLIGAMFAPRPDRVTDELLRVTRAGGRIVMGNWTPESFVGEFFATVGRHAPPPEMPSPLLWGSEDEVRKRFDQGVSKLTLNRMPYEFHYPVPPEDVVDYYAEHFGPVKSALERLDAEGKRELRDDLARLWREHNQGEDGMTFVIGEILEVVAIRE